MLTMIDLIRTKLYTPPLPLIIPFQGWRGGISFLPQEASKYKPPPPPLEIAVWPEMWGGGGTHILSPWTLEKAQEDLFPTIWQCGMQTPQRTWSQRCSWRASFVDSVARRCLHKGRLISIAHKDSIPFLSNSLHCKFETMKSCTCNCRQRLTIPEAK